MHTVILDTNVIIGASGISGEMSARCQLNCTQRITQWRKKIFHLVIDTEHIILDEYIKQFKSLRAKPGFSGSAAEALLNELATLRGVSDAHAEEFAITRVILTILGKHEFEEYPQDDVILASFDLADRKWIAAALSCQQYHNLTPEILNAADSDWDSVAEHLLNTYGVPVSNICG